MINKILFEKSLPFPHISFSLILSCLIISIPILFNNVLYAFLGANVGLVFPWQYLTSVFAHGPEPPLLIHLFINLLIIIFCVSITEKLLGTWRSFLILVFTATLITLIRFETFNFYNGISTFIFTFAPFALLIWLNDFNNRKKNEWQDYHNIIMLFVLPTIVVIYPIYFSFIDSVLSERNILYFISFIIGAIFLVVWRRRFFATLFKILGNQYEKSETTIWDKLSRIVSYLITGLNFLVLLIVLIYFN